MTDNKPLSSGIVLLIGILLGAIFLMLALGVQIHDGGNFNFTLTTTGIPSGESTTYENVTYVTEGGETVTVQRADLRQVALPYIVAFPNSQAICVAAGATGLQHGNSDSRTDAVPRDRRRLYLQRNEHLL